MKRHSVRLTEQALQDLDDIAHYIALNDSPERADHVAQRIEEAILSLSTLPDRGPCPRELLALGNRAFREIHFKPYRIIYRVYDSQVVIFIIADGRRDLRTVLARRLLGH